MSNEEVKKITSIQDLLEILTTDNYGYEGSIWYRGQSNFKWGLLPGYLRVKAPVSEYTLLQRFKQNAALLIESRPSNSFDWLFLMQHYGVPTRLLDWSESPLVALYFALDPYKIHPEEDAALWALRPSELNKNAGIRNSKEIFYIPSFDDDHLSTYTVESLQQNSIAQLFPIATIATRNNPRIQAQHGVFTIHHLDNIPIEDVGDKKHTNKYLIPAQSKGLLLKQLEVLGYSRFQLFPELASIGEKLQRMFI